MEKATYRKAMAMVSMVAVVDDKRRVQEVLLLATPGTPIADFLDEHEEELRRRMEETQVLLTAATADMSSANLTMEEKFSKVWEKFKVEKKSVETLEKEIEEVRSAAMRNEKEKEMPKPRIPVYHLTQEEAADYLQELLSFIQRNILKVKRTEFRKVFKLYQKYFSVLPRNYL